MSRRRFRGLDGRGEPEHAGDRRGAGQAGRHERPIVVASANGLRRSRRRWSWSRRGTTRSTRRSRGWRSSRPIPRTIRSGYGGLPNEDGVVELDAAVMHGPTHGGGSVASIRNIMHPAAVARW